MKKFFPCAIVALSSLLYGCSTYPDQINKISVLDYSRYTKDGFFITESNSVSFDYEPIASISVDMYDGKVANTNYWGFPDAIRGLELLVQKAKYSKGNGIINLKIEPFSVKSANYQRSGIRLTGMAIKR